MDRDIVRNDYLGTLPSTLRNRDIRVEFTTAEGEAKAYLIRKYLDADIQRDIWDMLVVRDGELKTKIARKDKKGRAYVESIIIGAGSEASQPTTAGGLQRAPPPHATLPLSNKAIHHKKQARRRANPANR